MNRERARMTLDLRPDVLAALEEHTGKVRDVTRPPQGENVQVWQVDAASGWFIVKSAAEPAKVAAVAREASVLETLTAYAPQVPRYVARAGDVFLFTYLPGVNLAVVGAASDSDARRYLSGEYGRLLRVIHGWNPPVPRPANWFADALTRVERNAADVGWDTPVASHGLWGGVTHRAAWQEVADTQSSIRPQVVWCHGDWCLPNVLIEKGRATGAIDWGDGGWMDFRVDLAMGLWSLRFNFGTLDSDPHLPTYLDAFLAGYGYPDGVGSLRFWEALSLLY